MYPFLHYERHGERRPSHKRAVNGHDAKIDIGQYADRLNEVVDLLTSNNEACDIAHTIFGAGMMNEVVRINSNLPEPPASAKEKPVKAGVVTLEE